MVKLCCFPQISLLLAVAAHLLVTNFRLATAAPQRRRAGGVFLLIEGGKYTMDFTAARRACLSLNATMATRAQVERAIQDGLETCKYGWIEEQIAVVPRITSNERCGQGETGLVIWTVKLETKFAVYCYNGSVAVIKEIHESLTADLTSSIPPTAWETQSPITPPTAPSTPNSAPPTDTPERMISPSTETANHSVGTTPSTRTPHTTSVQPLSTLSTLSTLAPPLLVTSASGTSARTVSDPSSSEPVLVPSVSPAETTLGAGPVALITTGVLALFLMAAGVVWNYKLDIFPWCFRRAQKYVMETEMWKQTSNEVEQHHQGAATEDEKEGKEEEEPSKRKYCSEVTLFVNPGFKADSAE